MRAAGDLSPSLVISRVGRLSSGEIFPPLEGDGMIAAVTQPSEMAGGCGILFFLYRTHWLQDRISPPPPIRLNVNRC